MQPIEIESIQPVAGCPPHADPAPVADPRVYLAAERTFLAWVRTSVALMGIGFLIARFAFWLRESALLQGVTPRPNQRMAVSPWLVFGMMAVGVYHVVKAAIRHRDHVRALKAGVANPSLELGTLMTVAAVLALVGMAMSIQILLF